MTTGPRNTPHPIILHVDESNNPVRLAEASSIYVTSATIVSATITTISATNWLGLESLDGFPGGSTYEVQYKGADGNFAAENAFRYDPTTNLLIVPNLYIGNLSSTNFASLDEVRAISFSSIGLSSTSFNTDTVNSNNIYVVTLSATTVCATNYDAQFDALSFSNLDSRYLNSAGDSVTGNFVVQALSATTISAINYLNLPSAIATWNASSIQGRSVTSTAPSLGESLVWLGSAWGPSAVAGGAGGNAADPNLSIQFKNGAFFSGTGNVTYNQSISGIESVGLSSTNLISRNISATIVSATSYLNLREGDPLWNASKIQDADVLKDILIANGDILVYTTPGNNWETHTPSEYADFIYPVIQNRIPSAAAVWNASSIQGRAVTSTPPVANNVLIFNGSVWTPSSAIYLSTVSSTNLSSVSARITGLSATTISAVNWQGLPSAVATWNANKINGIEVLGIDEDVTGTTLGAFFYSRPNNQYYTLPFSSVAIAGSRDVNTLPSINPQGQIVASYLGSATPSLQINPVFATPGINDVLVFSSNLYGSPVVSGWTWQQASSLITPTTAAGSFGGVIQVRGPNGEFSSIPDFYYDAQFSSLRIPKTMYFPDEGYLEAYWITSRSNVVSPYVSANFIDVATQIRPREVSATTYKLFGANTSSTGTVTANNQTITYDFGASRWKPGYTVFQATATPTTGIGSDGDIYFQYLP